MSTLTPGAGEGAEQENPRSVLVGAQEAAAAKTEHRDSLGFGG